jgi:hypothetical protein
VCPRLGALLQTLETIGTLRTLEPGGRSGSQRRGRPPTAPGRVELHGGMPRAAALAMAPKPSPATLLNGEPCSAKVATPPAIGVTKPDVSVPRRRAASVAVATSCASTRSMRAARSASQKRDDRAAGAASPVFLL